MRAKSVGIRGIKPDMLVARKVSGIHPRILGTIGTRGSTNQNMKNSSTCKESALRTQATAVEEKIGAEEGREQRQERRQYKDVCEGGGITSFI